MLIMTDKLQSIRISKEYPIHKSVRLQAVMSEHHWNAQAENLRGIRIRCPNEISILDVRWGQLENIQFVRFIDSVQIMRTTKVI